MPEIVEVTQFILQERIVEHIADVTSASDTGTNSGFHRSGLSCFVEQIAGQAPQIMLKMSR